MKKLIITTLIAAFLATGLASHVRAEKAAMDEAQNVAKNWITTIIHKKGSWGEHESADVEQCLEFRRGDRLLGYFCAVEPEGFIMLSLLRELTPVKAYAAAGTPDPTCDDGAIGLMKSRMELVLNAIVDAIGPVDSADGRAFDGILQTNFRSSWDLLGRDPIAFKKGVDSGAVEMNYEGGAPPLLAAQWDQRWPYNALCPNLGCTHPELNGHALVGCGPLATAQILRYWGWPPHGVNYPTFPPKPPVFEDPYDWANMPDILETNAPVQQILATAELCSEIGIAWDASYGCDGTSVIFYDPVDFFADWEDILEDFFRCEDNMDWLERDAFDDFFSKIQNECSKNRPVAYYVWLLHGAVVDGWQIFGNPPTKQYHVNYGHGPTAKCDGHLENYWYTGDDQICGEPVADDMILTNIRPAPSLGPVVAGIYAPDAGFPYGYFDQDALGVIAGFLPGYKLQFLHNVVVKGAMQYGIRFTGSSLAESLLFSRGDQTKGIRISNGSLILHSNGGIKFH